MVWYSALGKCSWYRRVCHHLHHVTVKDRGLSEEESIWNWGRLGSREFQVNSSPSFQEVLFDLGFASVPESPTPLDFLFVFIMEGSLYNSW